MRNTYSMIFLVITNGIVIIIIYSIILLYNIKPNEFYFSEVNTIKCPSIYKPSIDYVEYPGGLEIFEDKINFKSNSIVKIDICNYKKLIIDAEPKLGGKEAPVLVVSLDGLFLAELTVNSRKKFVVNIPKNGTLRLGYFNDYYESEARIIKYEDFSMNNSDCHITYSKDLSEYKSNHVIDGGDLYVASSVPIIVKPCRKGVMKFFATGFKADNKYGIIKIMQDGKVLTKFQTSGRKKEEVEVSVSDSPLQIEITNYLSKEKVDRNIYIRHIKLIN